MLAESTGGTRAVCRHRRPGPGSRLPAALVALCLLLCPTAPPPAADENRSLPPPIIRVPGQTAQTREAAAGLPPRTPGPRPGLGGPLHRPATVPSVGGTLRHVRVQQVVPRTNRRVDAGSPARAARASAPLRDPLLEPAHGSRPGRDATPLPLSPAPAPRDLTSLVPDDGPVPDAPPPPPPLTGPGLVRFRTADPPYGLFEARPDGENRVALIMLGNPRIDREAFVDARQRDVPELRIRANVIVAWADPEDFPAAAAQGGVVGAQAEPNRSVAVPGEGGTTALDEALLAVYAEGAVMLQFGDMVFRAEALYIDLRENFGLLVKPRLDGDLRTTGFVKQTLPVHLRAARARLLADGFTAFDDAELAVSRANDRFALKLAQITVEELGETVDENGNPVPDFLGYRELTEPSSRPYFRARDITVRGEGIDLITVPRLEFGGNQIRDVLPAGFRGVRSGRDSQLGFFAFPRYGETVKVGERELFDWLVEAGVYTSKGPGAGFEIEWDHRDSRLFGLRSFGRVTGFGVWDLDEEDQDGFVPPSPLRGRFLGQSRTWLTRELTFDAEVALLSDRGFELEYFERDILEEKERESYGRLKWQPAGIPGTVGTFTVKPPIRDFVTETALLPAADLWLTSLPVLVPRRKGALAMDLSGEFSAAYLERHYADFFGDPTRTAFRTRGQVLLNAAFDLGDLRIAGYAGPDVTSYSARQARRPSLTRSALLAGIGANLQLHRCYPAMGTWLQLYGARHIIDLDARFHGRFADSHERADVDFFDRYELERERSAFRLQVRNRLQTRRATWRRGVPVVVDAPVGRLAQSSDQGLRTVADLVTTIELYPDDRGPYLTDTPGRFTARFDGEPRPGWVVAAETRWDLEHGLETAYVSVGFQRQEGFGSLEVAGAVRYLEDFGTSMSALTRYRWSEKYGISLRNTYDAGSETYSGRLLLERFSDDHVWTFGISYRDGFNFEIGLDPLLGNDPRRFRPLFDEEARRDPFGLPRMEVE